MVSKSQIKLVRSLHQKKYRKQEGLFIAEGVKVISELLESKLLLHQLFTTDATSFSSVPSPQLTLVSEKELKQLSVLKTPNTAVAVFKVPKKVEIKQEGLILALDEVQDPGNLGTIIRLCDWFGVTQLVCSLGTVDHLNPKVVQATMGSLARVDVHYESLTNFLESTELPVFGGFMLGENIYEQDLPKAGVLIMGNEGNGISEEVTRFVQKKLTIPQFGEGNTESLNVATATAILLSEFRRSY